MVSSTSWSSADCSEKVREGAMEGALGPVGSSGAQHLVDSAMTRAVCVCIILAGVEVETVVDGGFELSPLVGGG